LDQFFHKSGEAEICEMDLIVCLKQVPDPENPIEIDSHNRLVFNEDVKWITNPFDEYGLEAALQLKEKYSGHITVLSVGPRRTLQTLRIALAKGADEGILILENGLQPWDSIAAASALFSTIKDLKFDLILTGQRGIDGEMGVTGPSLAGHLGIACLSQTVEIEISDDEKSIRTKSQMGCGVSNLEAALPAVVCADKGLNEPRSFSLADLRKADRKKIKEKVPAKLEHDQEALLNPDAKLSLVKLSLVFDKRPRIIIEGDTSEEKAANLARILKSKEKLL
jgi:electron transfer flavoprotein beta subunit